MYLVTTDKYKEGDDMIQVRLLAACPTYEGAKAEADAYKTGIVVCMNCGKVVTGDCCGKREIRSTGFSMIQEDFLKDYPRPLN